MPAENEARNYFKLTLSTQFLVIKDALRNRHLQYRRRIYSAIFALKNKLGCHTTPSNNIQTGKQQAFSKHALKHNSLTRFTYSHSRESNQELLSLLILSEEMSRSSLDGYPPFFFRISSVKCSVCLGLENLSALNSFDFPFGIDNETHLSPQIIFPRNTIWPA